MKRNVIGKMICSVFVLLGLSACGGGSSSTTPDAITATGKFIDAPVEGLKYVSGGHNGFTGASGEFTYEVGQSVTFSVGGVVVGQALGANVVTPIDLVKTVAASGTSVTASTPEVVQIAQFLLTASSLTTTGIKIDPAITSACASQSINLSSASKTNFNPVMSQIAASAGNRTVTTATDAQSHITASMAALNSGTTTPVLPSPSILGGTITYSISGKVTNAAGAAISGVTITAKGSTSTNVTTASDGSYTFSGAQNGNYTLSASLSGSTFNPSTLSVTVGNANATGNNFISLAELTGSLYGNKFFGFAGGVVDGGIPSEIMYNDVEGYLILPHSSAQQVTQAYSSIIQAPYGIYQDSNNGAPTDRFPVTAGTVYIFRSVMPFGNTASYYKLEIISSTKRPDVNSTNYGVVTFKYAPILPIDIVNAVGRWQFADGSIVAVLPSTIQVDYTATDTKFYAINASYSNSSTLTGTFSLFNADNTVSTGSVTISLAVTVDGKLNATLTGDAPLGSATLTGGIKQ